MRPQHRFASLCRSLPGGVYVSGLIDVQAAAAWIEADGLAVFIAAIKFNFYPMLMIVFTLLICLGVVPDFGPMRTAEIRAEQTGALIRPGAKPLVSDDGDDVLESVAGRDASLVFELVIPVVLLLSVGAWSLYATDSVKIVEAFMLANVWLFSVLAVRGSFSRIDEVADVIVAGTKSVMAALLIVAMAYALNAVTTELGAGQFIIDRIRC